MLTAEEATALIGAHSIGSTRHIFGASMSGSVSSNVHLVLVTSPQQAWSSLHPTSFVTLSQLQWVTSGADYATPCECLFLCFFTEMFVKTVSTTFFSQSFLVNQLSTSSSYCQSVPSLVMHFMTSWVTRLSRMMLSPSPPILESFDWDFFSWFRIDPTRNSPIAINHLDTDIALAFPSLDLSVHPHFNGFTSNFASDNSVFLAAFFPALQKMSQLGVDVARLLPATSCVRCPGVVFGGKVLQHHHQHVEIVNVYLGQH